MLVLALEESIHINGEKCRSCVIDPATFAEIETKPDKLIAKYYFDRTDIDSHIPFEGKQGANNDIAIGVRGEANLIKQVRDIYDSEPSLGESFNSIARCLSEGVTGEMSKLAYPRPVFRLLNYIRLNPVDEGGYESIAMMEGINREELYKQFEQCVGIGVRRYQEWRRIHEVANMLHSGLSMRAATIRAGFKGLTEFESSFVRFFGVEPKQVFNSNTKLIMSRY